MKNINKKELGNRIRKLREYFGFDRKRFAEEFYVNPKTLGAWERGDTLPSEQSIKRLIYISSTDEDFILYGKVNEEHEDNPYVQTFNDSLNICWRCGKFFSGEHTSKRTYCAECKESHEKEDQELLDKYVEMKNKIMWRRAINELEKQNLNMDSYYEEAKYVLDLALSDYGKFSSSPEMMVAIELLRQRIKAKVQYKILKYKVDFFLPDLKAVLEVDGRLHDFKVDKDSNRDVAILNELNKEDSGWEIIRIPTKFIYKDVTKVPKAVQAVRKEKLELRKKHGGFIPSHFSRRDSYQYSKIDDDYKEEHKEKMKDEWKVSEL